MRSDQFRALPTAYSHRRRCGATGGEWHSAVRLPEFQVEHSTTIRTTVPFRHALLERDGFHHAGELGEQPLPPRLNHPAPILAAINSVGGDCGNPLKRCRRQNPDGGNISQMGSFGNSGASVIFYYCKNIIYVYLLIFALSIRVFLAGTDCQF